MTSTEQPLESWPSSAAASRPYVRWWWLEGPFHKSDIVQQLDWLKANGFGGVELAWLDPLWQPESLAPRPEWLGSEWAELTSFTKHYADSIGLGCDFTFGSAWPFGAGCISEDFASRNFRGATGQHAWASWEAGPRSTHLVLNHLDRQALQRYADHLLPAFATALEGSTSALFCDSLELHTEGLWSTQLWEEFRNEFGYSIEDFVDDIHQHPDVRYDYRKLISKTFTREFFRAFTDICHGAGARSRVQCHGAPVDLLEAYAAVDVPESEALLFEPRFSRIPASAAALSGKPIVSAETFTCVYGFFRSYFDPARKYWKRDQIGDLKLLADAIFANGVNQIIWHGMPYNAGKASSDFYAAVHVGPDAELAPYLSDFNDYLTRVSNHLATGRTFSQLAVYLPIEDAWMQNRIPAVERTPAANYRWEMRHAEVAPETEGFNPLWISTPFLNAAEFRDGRLQSGEAIFEALYIDCEWLDAAALTEILRLAKSGLPVVFKRVPRQPGHIRSQSFVEKCDELRSLPNCVTAIEQLGTRPLISGTSPPRFWTRISGDELLIFFAHPLARSVEYPLKFGQSSCHTAVTHSVQVNWDSWSFPLELHFEPYQSLMFRCSRKRQTCSQLDIQYRPPEPKTELDWRGF